MARDSLVRVETGRDMESQLFGQLTGGVPGKLPRFHVTYFKAPFDTHPDRGRISEYGIHFDSRNAQHVLLDEFARAECGIPLDRGHLSDVFNVTR
jgi:hypothetical protein